jgi:glutathione transport system permease protein
LPSLTLGAAVAVMARFTRASFVDVLHEDYMRTARAKGVSETGGAQAWSAQCDDPGGDHDGAAVRLCSAARSSWRRSSTGRGWALLVDSVEMRDYPVIQAEVLLFRWSLFLSI